MNENDRTARYLMKVIVVLKDETGLEASVIPVLLRIAWSLYTRIYG